MEVRAITHGVREVEGVEEAKEEWWPDIDKPGVQEQYDYRRF